MKQKWKYLLGAFLLTAGLLAGCSAEAVPARESAQTVETEALEAETPDEALGTEAPEELDVLETEASGESEIPEASEEETLDEAEIREVSEEEILDESEIPEVSEADASDEAESQETEIAEDGTYTSKEEVAEYLFLYGHLPDNFITKKEAKALGWVSSEGNLAEAAPGKSIGGDYFGNFEGNLPEKKGREYHECDIDSNGGYRGAKRLVYSNDGLIYYTEDHYETFELLYGEE